MVQVYNTATKTLTLFGCSSAGSWLIEK